MRETQENKKPMITDMIENCSNKPPFYYPVFFFHCRLFKNRRIKEIKIHNVDVLSIAFHMPKL